MPKVLFYAKCRPQGADAWPIAQKHQRVFIGYPVRLGEPTNWCEHGVRSVFVDLRDSDFDTISKSSLLSRYKSSYKSQVTSNRRLAIDIERGSIVLVPRVNQGVCHAAEIANHFELVNHPCWVDEYFALRLTQNLDVKDDDISHVGDIAQTWPVSEWHTLSFPALPRWISYRLLSRNTAGIINDLDYPLISALTTIRKLMLVSPDKQYETLQRIEDLEVKLLSWLTPTSFEHLVIDLLQLEAPQEIYWHHVGGSGDGGADGIAVDTTGRLRAILQCKWHYDSSPDDLAHILRERSSKDVEVIIAILHGQQASQSRESKFTFWNLNRVAELVRQHMSHLPMARAFSG